MKKIILFFAILIGITALAHPMPNSVIALDVHSKTISCELQLPLKELQFAVPYDVTENTKVVLEKHQEDLSKYIISHFSIIGSNGEKWDMKIDKMQISRSEQLATGKFEELIVNLSILPKNTDDIRNFAIQYDAIVHQVVTHKILVTIRNDWENGKIGENNTDIGTITTDFNTNKVPVFKVNLAKGSQWKGFKSMVILGMKHIAEGTDHLLFILVLLLSAPLIAQRGNWTQFGGTPYSLKRIFKIVTAFTIGHSITLIIGSFGWINPNSKIVEIVIAFSILVTAIHAIKPIFPNKELYVAAVFGLIHGMAFATVLKELNLETNKLVLSLLGFNIGIELMQLLVIILVMPWLMILSPFKIYKWVRIFGAILAAIAALAWMAERITGRGNIVSVYLLTNTHLFVWGIIGLALFSIVYFQVNKRNIQTQ